ncbi:MAG TPA: bifunctional phosphopantothenoylcysteine decarboxylase/phosphopantothenate--cysteine ligase CoaBC [Longimicrobiales bacterium]|nr:bifunctional phosphopantothenoylcysteine decarboxylase/phosphopantothenate--cysteine ligase CoaBC [Longimicrobiales bacterium]
MPDRPRPPWADRRVVLGVTGGIAAYKTILLARRLTRLGAEVDVVLSRSAREFVTPLTFEGVTGRPVLTELFSVEGAARHIRLGREADVVCVAPATADLLARAAQGRADDLLTTTLLVTRAPVLLCPAMNDRMWDHPQVAANAAHCQGALGYQLLGPAEGPLAVGEAEGPGRMVEPDVIVEHLGRLLTSPGSLTGRRVLVTSGPTREPLDPVRYLGNRSSGRMGFAVATAAWRRGAEVVVVSGPTGLPAPPGVEVVPVETAVQMAEAVTARIPDADVAVFAAAVADYRPADASDRKRKRSRDGDAWSVELTTNPDVAATAIPLRRDGAVMVGFALETEDLLANARAKREAKGFDLVVANPADAPDAGFGADTNRVTLVGDGEPESLPLLSKDEVAEKILDRVAALLERGA